MATAHDGSPRPRRVLFVENGIGYGGAIICLRHLVRNLDRSRYEPIVVTGRDDAPYQGIAAEAEWGRLPAGSRVTKGESLFPRIYEES